MAITKERLKELIEQGATVYSIESTFNDERCIVKYTLNNHFIETDNNRLIYLPTYNHVNKNENLYEHKADAEWDLEFGNVEKRIKFVKPKPFKKLGKWPTFLYENHGFFMEKGYGGRLYVYYKDDHIYGNAFNEENYTEACRLIKKLFMGEE